MKIFLSLVVPFYNEKQIISNYRKLSLYLKKHLPQYELILVSDGSERQLVNKLKKIIKGDTRATLVYYRQNQGRGYAVSQGFQKARGQYLAYIDADLEINPLYLERVVNCLKKDRVVIASKFVSGSKITTPFFRRVASLIFNTMIRLVLDSKVKDHQTGLKGFRREVIDLVLPHVREKRWLFDTEILYLIQKKGYSIKEIPILLTYGFERVKGSFIVDFLKLFMVIFLIKRRHRNFNHD